MDGVVFFHGHSRIHLLNALDEAPLLGGHLLTLGIGQTFISRIWIMLTKVKGKNGLGFIGSFVFNFRTTSELLDTGYYV